MKVIRTSDAETREVTNEPLFTGGKVMAKFLVGPDTAEELSLALITFSPGAKCKFHTHDKEQILYVTEGKGIVATEDEEIVVTPGMTAYIPAGEKHWHGATEDSSFSHISLTPPHKTEL
jgi:quercetin dioxygenase-like cupin family protein